ncbi:CDP-diacylglycerol--glycerol-3-phosphate 3-phosphatidyltransferase, mitochondrial-like [Anneissia japonica]|uniref:CDP-diacylglycerol--glycerol-3-phosphate 3-phosphatidyltransferase, mitochondrial-like n=1 Tax=Anneissia japonica TaxID=1529436 RepID=UPI00142588AA|nr:CDP-diacylglycerol--glycerol-3-phosphate 3-phosphatidyltransferase, mitochondrial-like [Anneissia japonica]
MLFYKQLLTSHKQIHQLLTRTILRCVTCCGTAREKFNWLKDYAPKFGINGGNVTVLDGPQHFYSTLKTGIENANKRVVLASLYLGEGQLEQALIDSLLSRCSESELRGAPIKVQVLLDYTRGSRGVTNSRTLLLPLLQGHGETSQVALYHTPHLRGILRSLIPERYNEVIGLSHLKVYLFDDSLVMSGANLSNDYFTNRQDRYILFRNVPEVSEFFCQLVTTVSTFSLQLDAENSIDLHPSFQIHPFRDNLKTFNKEASKRVKSLIGPYPNQDDGGHHTFPIPHNTNLADAISEKFTTLSKAIPSKPEVMSRNYSSLSQHCLEFDNTATDPVVSDTNYEKGLKLLDELNSILTRSHGLQKCDDIQKLGKHITNLSGSNKENNDVDRHEVAINSNHGVKKHLSIWQPFNATGTDHSSLHNNSVCKSITNSHCNMSVDTHHGASDDGKQLSMNKETSGTINSSNNSSDTAGKVDTWLYPLVQMGTLGITVDQEVTGKLLQTAGEDSTCVLASGYFNLVEEYLDLITNSRASYRILMASPQVNGFYKAKGFPGYIPDAYTFIARKFYNRMKHTGQLARVKLFEFHKQNWTFHAKGLWLCINGHQVPSLTLIGSPNFGYRSVHRDLEAQVALVTENHSLQNQLHQEHIRLFKKSKPVSAATFDEPDRKEPLWVRLIVPIIKNFF